MSTALLREIERLEYEKEILKLAVKDAIAGTSMAYDCVEKKFNDEALLHLGHHNMLLHRVLEKVS